MSIFAGWIATYGGKIGVKSLRPHPGPLFINGTKLSVLKTSPQPPSLPHDGKLKGEYVRMIDLATSLRSIFLLN